jgi:hypothetical protein
VGTKAALTGGYHLAFWVAAALVAVSVAIALFVLEPVDGAHGAGGQAQAAAEGGADAPLAGISPG